MRLGSSTLLALLGLAVVVQSLPIASLPIDGNAYGYDKNLTPARDNKPTLPGFNWDIPKSDKQVSRDRPASENE